MDFYIKNYFSVLKRNYMLLVMALVLSAVTFFIWVGVPFFIIGSFVAEFTSSFILTYISISLSGGFLFSFYYVPVNVKVAKNIAVIRRQSPIITFVHLQTIWGLVFSVLFALILGIVIQF